jgi:hypothetical protein|tara:strand:+ start:1631 stop:2356 length:726 start_codon:yes stop_codon:yes gene_type:complete
MPIIFKTNSCKILKSKNNYKFIYEDGEKYKLFFEKIKKNIKNDIVSQRNNKSFTIKASKVEGLKELLKRKNTLSYRHLKQLFTQINKQLQGLEENGYCNLFLDLNDIVRIETCDETQQGGSGGDIFFLYLNTHNFLPIIDTFNTKILKPFDKNNKFLSIELKKLNTFPKKVHINSQYYSLALLTIYCCKLSKKYTNVNFNKLDLQYNKFSEYLSNIENTKLYYALLRCLVNNPKDRVSLYI